jgi:Zn-finger nucleic acid-binding protein
MKLMKCPIDGEVLVIAERKGVEIDYCPQCRGVWLDRGELEKIIDQSTAAGPSPAPQSYRDDGYDTRRPRKKRAESFLGELFDF